MRPSTELSPLMYPQEEKSTQQVSYEQVRSFCTLHYTTLPDAARCPFFLLLRRRRRTNFWHSALSPLSLSQSLSLSSQPTCEESCYIPSLLPLLQFPHSPLPPSLCVCHSFQMALAKRKEVCYRASYSRPCRRLKSESNARTELSFSAHGT